MRLKVYRKKRKVKQKICCLLYFQKIKCAKLPVDHKEKPKFSHLIVVCNHKEPQFFTAAGNVCFAAEEKAVRGH